MNQPTGYPQTPYPMDQKPGMITALGIVTLISGILNIMLALGLTGTIVIGTLGIGLLCAPLTILPAVLGIFEILYAAKLLSNPPQPVQPSQTIAILQICTIVFGNALTPIAGILALVFYNDPAVRAYFMRINMPPGNPTGGLAQ